MFIVIPFIIYVYKASEIYYLKFTPKESHHLTSN